MTRAIVSREVCELQDLARGRRFFVLWGAPIAIDVVVSIVQGFGWISLWVAAVLWTAATLWIGASCLINARRCSRTHCMIAGVLLLPLGAVGVAYVVGVVSFSWSIVGIYWDAFWAIVVVAFVTEFLWKPYYRC